MTKELAWELAETAHALRRYYEREVAEVGVTRAQWRVLAWLSREPGLKQVELAERMDIEPITLCRMVDRLEDAGLVSRERDPDDRRAWRLRNTDKAAPILGRLGVLAEDMADVAFDGLDDETRHALRRALSVIRTNVAQATDKNRISA